MQKNRKQRNETTETATQRTYSAVNTPEVVSIDVLATMSDEDMIDHLRALEQGLDRAETNGRSDPRVWQEEIAYVRREQQVRRVRRETHAEFVRTAGVEFESDERHLPAGDFDNMAFVYAATGGRPTRWS